MITATLRHVLSRPSLPALVLIAVVAVAGCSTSGELAPGDDLSSEPVTVEVLEAVLLTGDDLGPGWVTDPAVAPFETAPTAGCPGPQLVSPSYTDAVAGLAVYTTSAPTCGDPATVLDTSDTTIAFYADLYTRALAASAEPEGLTVDEVTVTVLDTGVDRVVGFDVTARLTGQSGDVPYRAVLLRTATGRVQLDAQLDSRSGEVPAAAVAELVSLLAGAL